MFVKNIKLSNFKSFKEIDVDLINFNVLIGANASGKSNFTKAFRFLKNVEKEGLENAVSLGGGIENLQNIHLADSSEMQINFTWFDVAKWLATDKKDARSVSLDLLEYSLSLGFKEFGQEFFVLNEKFTETLRIHSLVEGKKDEYTVGDKVAKGQIHISRTSEGANVKYSNESFESFTKNKRIMPDIESSLSRFGFLDNKDTATRPLLLETPYLFMPPQFSLASKTGLYDIDPALARLHAPIAGKTELEEDGSNLALVLREIVKDKEKKRKLVNLLQDVLPFVNDINAKKSVEKAVMLTVKEEYYEDKSLPSDLLSDGTINIVALIVALYFEEQDIVIIEEPERNIHPSLISSVVNMMKDASSRKQIIVTTHSPIVVKHAGVDNLLFVSRDYNGYSHISRPNQQEDLKIFMENDLGLDEIYIQNLFRE